MDTMAIQINVPKDLAVLINDADQSMVFERNAMILYPYIQGLSISYGRAAEILGVSKLELIDCYLKMGIPYLDQTPDEIENELARYKRIKGQ